MPGVGGGERVVNTRRYTFRTRGGVQRGKRVVDHVVQLASLLRLRMKVFDVAKG